MKGQKVDSTSRRRQGRRKRAGRRKGRCERSEEPAGSDRGDEEPKAKKVCLRPSEELQLKSDESAGVTAGSSKKSQLVIGTNAFTRCLEEGNLRVGVVCLSAKPAFLHKHILQLSSVRGVPVAALPNLSAAIAPLLGLKSTLAIGIKACVCHCTSN